MNISRRSAAIILREMSSIIGHDMNIMDRNGIILASTDPNRIGTFHEGAADIIENCLDELTISSDHYQYNGAKEGVNLPIVLNDEVVGVVGITGKQEEVGMYGRIIKRMTEILLADSDLHNRRKREEAMRERYIEEWVYDPTACRSPSFSARGLQMNINIQLPRCVTEAMLLGQDELADPVKTEQAMADFERCIRDRMSDNRDNIFTKTGSRYLWLTSDKNRGQLETLLTTLQADAEACLSQKLAVGCDSRIFTMGDLHMAMSHAEKALKASVNKGGALRFYEDITTELILNEIPAAARLDFIHRIFGSCTQEEIDQWVAFLQVFMDCNGSVGQTAQRLFMHKNTVQYKLKKLSELTGHDPRTVNGAALFYIALELLSLKMNNK